MKNKPKANPQVIELKYEMIEVNRVMANRNRSQYDVNASLQLYQRVYHGNGIRILLSRSVVKKCWKISFRTIGIHYDTGVQNETPHLIEVDIKEKCPLAAAINFAGKFWADDLMPELASLRLDPLRIDVVVRSCIF